MGLRVDLQTLLETIIGNVYFQPPPTIKMEYPCIVYEISNADTKFADNYPYSYAKKYTLTVIDKNPDSLLPDKVAALQRCIFNRHFTSDNLNHDVFNIYF
jgi:hypothetical protein